LRNRGSEHRVPSADLIAIIPVRGVGARAERDKWAVGIGSAGIAEVIVKVVFVITIYQMIQVPPQLPEPSLDKVLGVELDCFNLSDRRLCDNDPTNDNSVARYSDMLEGPTIAQELGTEVPLLCPIRLQTLSSFLISNDRSVIFSSEKIESTNVDKGIIGYRMPWEAWKLQGDRERVLKCRAISGVIRLNTIRSRRIDPNIVLDRGPHIFRSLWMALFSDDKISPLGIKGCECSRESLRGFKAI
jgi:hypothetical protein